MTWPISSKQVNMCRIKNVFCFKGNVLKEISEPAGATIYTSQFQLGDPTLSVMEIWGAEYQESNALLVNEKHRAKLQEIATREKCPVSFVGEITGNGMVSGMIRGRAELLMINSLWLGDVIGCHSSLSPVEAMDWWLTEPDNCLTMCRLVIND